MTVLSILLATVLVSLLSMIGVLFLSIRAETLKKVSAALVAFSSGGLIGGAFFHLLPKVYELRGEGSLVLVVVGILLFFGLEKGLCWRHCHKANCNVHMFTYTNLTGDAIHNFIDGLVIAAAFVVNTELGWVTTLVVAFHEVPQEMGDFGVIVYGGFSPPRALYLNLLSAVTAIAGGIIGYYFSMGIAPLRAALLALAAGSFVYIALADLVPELHKHARPGTSAIHFALMIAGLALLWAGKQMVHG